MDSVERCPACHQAFFGSECPGCHMPVSDMIEARRAAEQQKRSKKKEREECRRRSW